ncbi:MAG: hypothetical protein KGD63_01110 [Candidatus Lokiarchaeota archaeon]|nr:hypothetical protein [Candidatus Lokiarchaeota archaeon]
MIVMDVMEENIEIPSFNFKFKTYSNGQLAVFLQDYNGFPLAEISIREDTVDLNIDEFIFKDYSENTTLANMLYDSELIKSSNRFVLIGKHLCPICQIVT